MRDFVDEYEATGEPNLSTIAGCANARYTAKEMNIPSRGEITKILEEKLASEFPDESVEAGENWERIAEIFYAVGYEAAWNAAIKAEREACAGIADARAMWREGEAQGYIGLDEDEVTSMRSWARQFSMLAAEIRKRSNA